MRSPLGTGSHQGSAQGLWAGRTGEAELKENGIFQGCWQQIQVGRISPVPKSPLSYGTFTFLGPILLLGGVFPVLFNPHDKDGRDESHSGCTRRIAQTPGSTFPYVPSPPDLIL